MGYLKKHGKTFIKVTFYLILLSFYIRYYFVEQVIELVRGSTQFNGKIELVKVMPAPTITICMKPYFKASIANQYGYNSVKSILEDSQDITKYDLLKSMSYSFDKDFKLKVLTYEDNAEQLLDLSLGWNNFSQGSVYIKPISTLRHGLCYLMKTDYNVSVQTVTYFGLRLSFDSSLDKNDIPQEFEIYLTSPDGWYGIFFDDWAYFDQTYFTTSTELNEKYEWVAVLVPTQIEFKEGHENIENCLLNFISTLNCSNQCFPIIFNIGKLEPCVSPEDQKCIYDAFTLERNQLVHCMKPMKTMQYR